MSIICHTQQQIADELGIPRVTITDKIAENVGIGNASVFDNIRNFDERKIYTVWDSLRRRN